MRKVQENLLGIGEVVEKLKSEYHKLTKSMIRFWEKEGLISPVRTHGGHRKYSPQDIKRMKVIAELRHKRYLPISVVKHIIGRLDQDPNYDFRIFDDLFRPEYFDMHFQSLNLSEVAQETGLTKKQLYEIERLGFLPTLETAGQDRLFDQEDLHIMQLIKQVLDLGFTPTDLGFYVEDIKIHINNEGEFWKKTKKIFNSTKDRKDIYRMLLSNIGKIRSIIYKKYDGLEIGNVLGDE